MSDVLDLFKVHEKFCKALLDAFVVINSEGKTVLEEQLDILNGQAHWLNLATIAGGTYYLKLHPIEGQHLTKNQCSTDKQICTKG